MVDNILIVIIIAVAFTSICLSTFGTYRILRKSKNFLSEHTYKIMHNLINALLIETITIASIIIFPFVFAILYEKVDRSLNAAAIKKICYLISCCGLPISDVVKLICVKNYRFD